MRVESEVRHGAVVVGPGKAGNLKIDLGRQLGLERDGIVEMPVKWIPAHLRTPNSRFVIVFVRGGVHRVEEESVGRPKLELEDAVRRVLNRWDPIGVADDHDDEYDGYIGEIIGLLRSGADERVVAKYLDKMEVEWMGMGPGSWEQRRLIASELCRLPLSPP